MPIDPANIIALLKKHFNCNEKRTKINEEERKIARNLISTIENCLKFDAEIEEFNDLVLDENAEFDRKEGEKDVSDTEFS